MTLDTSTFSPGAESVWLSVSPPKGGYIRRQRWLLALLGGFLTMLRGVARALSGLLSSSTQFTSKLPKSVPESPFSVKSRYSGQALPRLRQMGSVFCPRRLGIAGGTVP